MAEIIQDPQLRYTPDNQIPVAEMLVQFPGLRDEDEPGTLKVVGWGNLAQEIQQHYHQGDRVVIEGRLNMNLIDRPEGFKEKRAELTAQRIHNLGTQTVNSTQPKAMTPPPTAAPNPAPNPNKVVPFESRTPVPTVPTTVVPPMTSPSVPAKPQFSQPSPPPAMVDDEIDDINDDEIPF